VVDIRFVFPDAALAALYHQERLLANSEGTPPVEHAEPVGEECHVFGGTRPLGPGLSMTAYTYIFRVGRVVVKLFAAQGFAARKPLTPDAVRQIAERIVTRLRRVA
jgi:hypothetical protein